ncbi:MAG TPA: hypothetical protein VGN97_16455 [Mesorhizobium sp.]|nr:hypothetical protein [Mesorhizobium sp.]
MLQFEVFEPIGIFVAPTNTTGLWPKAVSPLCTRRGRKPTLQLERFPHVALDLRMRLRRLAEHSRQRA